MLSTPYPVWACLIAETREVSERVEHTKRCMGSGKSWPVLSGKSKYKCPESKSTKSIFYQNGVLMAVAYLDHLRPGRIYLKAAPPLTPPNRKVDSGIILLGGPNTDLLWRGGGLFVKLRT